MATTTRVFQQSARIWRIPILGLACMLIVKLNFTTLQQGLHSRSVTGFIGQQFVSSPFTSDGTVNYSSASTFALDVILPQVTLGLGGNATNKIQSSSSMKEYDEQEYSEYHSAHTEIMDLLDWERKSLLGLLFPNVTKAQLRQTCQPPNGMSKTCCLGSFSSGGIVTAASRDRCAQALQQDPSALPDLRDLTKDFFANNPLITTENDKMGDNENDDKNMPCDICRIVEIARQGNLSIALMGDSMHSQVMEGLSCELERRNYHVRRETIDHNPNKEKTYPFRRHTTTQVIHIQSPMWKDTNQVVTIKSHIMYLLPLINDSIQNATAEADILILGFGLHWWNNNNTPLIFKREQSYVSAMQDLFQNITKQGHVKLLIHRETSAQHFDANGGEFSLWYENRWKLSQQCQPTNYNDTSIYWRERAIEKAANQSGLKLVVVNPDMPPLPPLSDSGINHRELVVLPFLNFTLHHHALHPMHDKFPDCTHFCSSPYIYYPIWRSLRIAMERQFAGDIKPHSVI